MPHIASLFRDKESNLYRMEIDDFRKDIGFIDVFISANNKFKGEKRLSSKASCDFEGAQYR